jgi:hypothetical protein
MPTTPYMQSYVVRPCSSRVEQIPIDKVKPVLVPKETSAPLLVSAVRGVQASNIFCIYAPPRSADLKGVFDGLPIASI